MHLSKADAAHKVSATEANRRRVLALAELRELVNAEAVASATEARFRADAEALLNWPASISAEMAAEHGLAR
ncbi:MAG: hypothetical protein IT158_20025 [Bryobacterales bacterium]|nr:hypothetical protein [Bryobacterales bacterium]